jgi:hypothetical protein
MATLTCNDFANNNLTDTIRSTCINLVRSVNYCAQKRDFPTSDSSGNPVTPQDWLTRVHHREGDNGWQTWYYPDSTATGGISACAFFQRMRKLGGYAMSIGFSKDWQTKIIAGNADKFVDMIAGDGATDGLLCYFIKKCLGQPWAPGQNYVNVVQLPSTSQYVNASYDAARDTLFNYVQGKSGAHWSMNSTAAKPFNDKFWGGNNNDTLNLWILNIT